MSMSTAPSSTGEKQEKQVGAPHTTQSHTCHDDVTKVIIDLVCVWFSIVQKREKGNCV